MAPPSLHYLSLGALVALAGINPWELQDKIDAGRPGQIDDLASEFHKSAGHVAEGDRVFDQACQHFRAGYSGNGGVDVINDSKQVQNAQKDFGLAAEQLKKISQNLEQVASALSDTQSNVAPQIAALNTNPQQIDTLAGMQGLSDQDRQSLRDEAAQAISSMGGQVSNAVKSYDDLLNAHIRAIEANGWTPSALLGDTSKDVPIPSPKTDPKKVNQWWKSLPESERERLIANHPDQIGSLGGVPTTDRSAANLKLMRTDLDAADKYARDHGTDSKNLVDNPDKYGLGKRLSERYKNALNVRDGLSRGNINDSPGTYLLSYKPDAFGGKGSAAMAIGNPDTAKNTAVMVPGTGHSVQQGWLTSKETVNVHDQANEADKNSPTALVEWLGYHPPDDLVDARVTNPSLARSAGLDLSHDVNSLWATHESKIPSHVTVIGHSYGSTVVADAACQGMHTNDIVLVGSPGVDLAKHASDFHLDGGHAYILDNSADPVGQIGEYGKEESLLNGLTRGHIGLGTDPAGSGFGATRLKSQLPDADLDGSFNFDSHGHYFDFGSESLYNIAAVSSGHGGDLSQEDMVAPQRTAPQVNLFGQHVEIPGLPKDHDDEVDRIGKGNLEFDANTSGKHY